MKGGVERRNLVTFTLGAAFVGVVAYFGSRIALGIVGGFRSWVIS